MERLCSTEFERDIKEQFPQVFTGLGTFGEEHHLKMVLKPFSCMHQEMCPFPKVRQELEHMERLGVIQKVSEPTPWCAGMVVVPLRNLLI